MTTSRARRLLLSVVGLVLVGAALVAALIGHLAAQGRGAAPTVYYTPEPVSQEISGEAREGCLLMGVGVEQINADPDSCLREYWTVDRLKRSTRIKNDWRAEQGMEDPCPPGREVCHLIGVPTPDYPSDDDPWWAEQAVRDPGRRTVDGVL